MTAICTPLPSSSAFLLLFQVPASSLLGPWAQVPSGSARKQGGVAPVSAKRAQIALTNEQEPELRAYRDPPSVRGRLPSSAASEGLAL